MSLLSFLWSWCPRNLQVSDTCFCKMRYSIQTVCLSWFCVTSLLLVSFIACNHSLLSRSVSITSTYKYMYFLLQRALLWLQCFDTPLTLLSHVFALFFFYQQQKIGIKASDNKVRSKTQFGRFFSFFFFFLEQGHIAHSLSISIYYFDNKLYHFFHVAILYTGIPRHF